MDSNKREGRSKAIEHYQTFLTLLHDAESGIPEVEDARKRVAGLQDQ